MLLTTWLLREHPISVSLRRVIPIVVRSHFLKCIATLGVTLSHASSNLHFLGFLWINVHETGSWLGDNIIDVMLHSTVLVNFEYLSQCSVVNELVYMTSCCQVVWLGQETWGAQAMTLWHCTGQGGPFRCLSTNNYSLFTLLLSHWMKTSCSWKAVNFLMTVVFCLIGDQRVLRSDGQVLPTCFYIRVRCWVQREFGKQETRIPVYLSSQYPYLFSIIKPPSLCWWHTNFILFLCTWFSF